MENPQTSPFAVISESDLKKMEDEKESTVHNIQQLIRNRLGRQREQIMSKNGALHRMYQISSQLPVELSPPRCHRDGVSPGTPEELASVRSGQVTKETPAKKESCNVELTTDMVKKGLMCHGYHPFLLKHTFLRLEIPSLDVKSLEAIRSYEHLMYLNVADNVIDDLSILAQFPSLLQLKAR